MSLYDELKWRGALYDATEGVEEVIAKEKLTGYIGFDPTAKSLHVGSLLQIMNLARFQRFGHTPIALVGGGTGLIGDPSGKTKERQLLTKADVEENVAGIRDQLARFLDFDAKQNPAKLLNNIDWLGSISFVDFLRDVGKYFTVNSMLAKESVKRRIESEDGISFTEFSYSLLQSYDYLVLYDRHNCRLQMGGSDQWGNIVSGADLVRRLRGAKAYGLVSPLVTTSTGVKFGKTEAGAVWLDAALTSPYRFYQFWLNTDDADVLPYLKYFTWLKQAEIAELQSALEERPEQREAQRTLAKEVTQMVHGQNGVDSAEKASQVLFGGEIEGMSAAEVQDIFQDVPSCDIAKTAFEGEGMSMIDLLAESGVAKSKGEARRLLQGGGVYLNNRKTEMTQSVTLNDSIDGQFLVLRKGRKNYQFVRIVG
ncbi:MAG: tyrosine--tRNA ligase [Calditrichaeota bacterium]|nr:tyrosine--tRNA ligase [Calditrichota bacterium]